MLAAFVAVVYVVMFRLPEPTHSHHHELDDPWVVVSRDYSNPYGTYIGNGFIATRVLGDGVGSWQGKPLPCFVAGLYNSEKLVAGPTWSDLRLYDSHATEFKIDTSEPYEQRLFLKSGILLTKATWRCGRKTLEGSIQLIPSRAQPMAAMILATLRPNFDGVVIAKAPVNVTDKRLKSLVLLMKSPSQQTWRQVYRTHDGKTVVALAMRLDSEVARAKMPVGTRPKLGLDGPAIALHLREDIEFMLFSRVALAIGESPGPALAVANAELSTAVAAKMDFIARSKAAWERLWKCDIMIDGSPEDQKVLRLCKFMILQSVREGSQWSIPPMGLSTNAFSGHVFWDADTWMFPALVLQYPELARSIVDYRYKTLSGALANAKAHGYKGAEYAWESGATGTEDTPPGVNYRQERHVNGDVALAQWQYYVATGNLKWLRTRGYPVISATADYWVSRATYLSNKDRYEIHDVVPPDENAEIVNNSAYTNAIAQMNLRFAAMAAKRLAIRPNPTWAEVADKLYIPFDRERGRFIAYDDYDGRQTKQADTELLIYPLQFKIGTQDMTKIYKNTFNYYSKRVSQHGPAMSASVHSIIAARLGLNEKAYDLFRDSYKPYLRGPFGLFNEKRSKTYENYCFLTGAAGPIQAVLYGFAGITIDYDSPGANLRVKPRLPARWKKLVVTGIHWQGRVYELTVDKFGAKVTPKR